MTGLKQNAYSVRTTAISSSRSWPLGHSQEDRRSQGTYPKENSCSKVLSSSRSVGREASDLHAFLHFFGRYFFDAACYPPDVSSRILNCGGPVAVELGCRFLLRGSASFHASSVSVVHVVNVDVQLAWYRIVLGG